MPHLQTQSFATLQLLTGKHQSTMLVVLSTYSSLRLPQCHECYSTLYIYTVWMKTLCAPCTNRVNPLSITGSGMQLK